MVSQPVISLPLLGGFGDLETGLLAGSVLQLFWFEREPLRRKCAEKK